MTSFVYSIRRIAVTVLLGLLFTGWAHAAEPDTTDAPPPVSDDTTVVVDTTVDLPVVDSADALPATVDTTRFEPNVQLDNAAPVTDSTNFELYRYQNPTVALFKSMAVPGWGQLGNRAYFKAVLFLGVDVFFIASALHHGRKAGDFRDQYEAAEDVAVRNAYYDLYEDSANDRNKFTWYAVITTFVAMFDAYVDAHLSGFPTEREHDRFSVDVTSSPEGDPRVSLSIRF